MTRRMQLHQWAVSRIRRRFPDLRRASNGTADLVTADGRTIRVRVSHEEARRQIVRVKGYEPYHYRRRSGFFNFAVHGARTQTADIWVLVLKMARGRPRYYVIPDGDLGARMTLKVCTESVRICWSQQFRDRWELLQT